MRVPRPPRSAGIRVIIFFLAVSIPNAVHGQELVVPDIVLPGSARDFIEFPGNYPDPSLTWFAEGPESRRLYPIADLEMPRPPVNLPMFSDLAELPPLALNAGNTGRVSILIKAKYTNNDVPGHGCGGLAVWRCE